MSTFLAFYGGNPTAGKKDGTSISEGTFASPIAFTLNATQEEAGLQKLAIRCPDGYLANGAVKIFVEHKKSDGTFETAGGNVEKYALCADNGYADAKEAQEKGGWLPAINLSGVTDTNTTFWLRCASTKTEDPSTDKDCVLHCEGIVKAKA